MRNIILTTLFITLVIGFSACSENENAHFKKSSVKLPITVICTTPATVDDYMTLLSGDTIVKDDPATIATTYHDINGIKKICLVSGAAHIVR